MHYIIYKQSGVALITAMLIVALASVAAIAMTTRQQLDIRRTGNILHADQAYLYALGGELWAMGILKKDLKSDKEDGELVDTLDENWARKLEATPIEGGQLSGSIEDLQGKFNLNNLYDDPSENAQKKSSEETAEETPDETPDEKSKKDPDLEYLKRLLRILELDEQIAQAIADWIDQDTTARFPDGSEDIEYLNMQTPYRTGNTRMVSPSELRLVKGITKEVYKKLEPFVSTLPERTTININTAPAELIAALSEEIDMTFANNLIDERNDKPFLDKKTFIARIPKSKDNEKEAGNQKGNKNQNSKKDPLEQMIDVSSNYFLLHGNVEIGKNQLRLSSVIERTKEGKAYILSRSIGAHY